MLDSPRPSPSSHESYYNPAYTCNACYVMRQGVNGGFAFFAADLVRRLLQERTTWDRTRDLAVVRYGTRMLMYESLRGGLGDRWDAPFRTGFLAEATAQAY